jgi:hypothetical protein
LEDNKRNEAGYKESIRRRGKRFIVREKGIVFVDVGLSMTEKQRVERQRIKSL